MKIKYNTELMKFITYFESATDAAVKDCFIDSLGTLTFVVAKDDAGKAIGKGGATYKKLEFQLKRKIKIIPFADDVSTFITNMLLPLKIEGVEDREGTIVIKPSVEHRGFIIGRAAQNLRNYEGIVQRYFDVKEIKVL